jgi:hypothetical protein
MKKIKFNAPLVFHFLRIENVNSNPELMNTQEYTYKSNKLQANKISIFHYDKCI